MTICNNLTDIARIGLIKKSGSEWSEYTKKITLSQKADFATIRVESTGVCGIYVNGTFLEVSCGRYPSRITFLEFTSLLKIGENEIKLVLGNNYIQPAVSQIFESNGTMFSCVACEINIESDIKNIRFVTDSSWECFSDDGQNVPCVFSEITKDEYQRYWKNAALWHEQKPLDVPSIITDVAGDEYKKLLEATPEKYKEADTVVETNLVSADGYLNSDGNEGYVIYDLGKLYVGYLELEYEAYKDTECRFEFDYTERLSDFKPGATDFIRRLCVTQTLEKSKNSFFLLRRRAFRYLKVSIKADTKFVIKKIRLLLDMMPYEKLGYFHCNDEKINKIWNVGRYTLHVNKKLEYESCPRCERKYFSGDGIIEALSDYYLFGDTRLTKSSLSLSDRSGEVGIRTDKLQKAAGLSDYPAWRIITAYNYYLYYGDSEFLESIFPDLCASLEWMIERINSKGLIFQHPLLIGDPYGASLGPTAYNSSNDYLGTNPLFNALLHKSLVCMSSLAKLFNDNRKDYWSALAEDVKEAFNNCLWNEEKQIFCDDYYKDIVFQDGNSLAVLFGLCDKEKSKAVLDTIKNENHTPYGSTMINKDFPLIRHGKRVISPLMCTYEAEARFLNDDSDGAIDLIRRCWGTMIDKKAETFWEFSPNNDTERWLIPAHGWASGCTYLLGAYVLGIRPKDEGYNTVIFEPYGGFESFCGVVPIKDSFAVVKCEAKGCEKKYTLAVPKGTVLDVHIPENSSLEIIEY